MWPYLGMAPLLLFVRPLMTLPSFPTFIDRLHRQLRASLPGTAAQLRMAPRYRMDPDAASVDGKTCREAGVLVVLFPVDDTPHFVLTVRRDDLPDHAGQVSFPGGQREDDETLDQTALREAHEEISLRPHHVDLLGPLTPLYIPPSAFCVHPHVGVLTTAPALRPMDKEVDRILRVPITDLLDASVVRSDTWTLRGEAVEIPFFGLHDQIVWGATAMMLAEFVTVCRQALAGPGAPSLPDPLPPSRAA